MATNKIIQTRIQQKIDTLAKWQEIWETFVPLKGEKILFQIPSGNPETVEGNGITPPQVISKTGDGVTTLKLLPWDSALAADVAAWAKPGNTGYDTYAGLPNRVSTLETEFGDFKDNLEIPDFSTLKTLTIEGIEYKPNGDGNVAIDLAGSQGINVAASGNTITVSGVKATKDAFGVVKLGSGVDIDENGAITVSEATYAETAGQVGNSLTLKAGNKEVIFNGAESKEFVVTAKDLGIELTTPLDFVGITTTELIDGATTNPIKINDKDYTAVAGDVVIRKDTDKEFLFVNGIWEELGDANTFSSALSQHIDDFNTYKTEEENWKTNNWKPFSTTNNGYTNKGNNANNMLFGDNSWHGAVRDDFIVFDCGSATMSEAEKIYATTLS